MPEDPDDQIPKDPDQARERLQRHEALMTRLTEPRDPEGNPLLHHLWEPWARKEQYVGDKAGRELRRCWDEDDTVGVFMSVMFTCKKDMEVDKTTKTIRQVGLVVCSFAAPSAEALAAIAEVSAGRVVEVGSGTGYWAKLLQARGVDVVAVDTGEESRLRGWPPKWFPETVKADGAEYLRAHGGCPDRALFMCWAREAFGDTILAEYKGKTLIWVGEPPGLSTWYLDRAEHPGWRLVREVEIPTWRSIHDSLRIYQRDGQ